MARPEAFGARRCFRAPRHLCAWPSAPRGVFPIKLIGYSPGSHPMSPSLPSRSLIQTAAFAAALLISLGPVAPASGESIRSENGAHLPVIPRTAIETARIAKVVEPTSDFSQAEPFEARPGGGATSFKRINRNAFSHASANMSFERELRFKVGNGLFKKLWVAAPASTDASDGLGPLYNARACQRCHLKDGRGRPPESGSSGEDARAATMFLRISVPENADDLARAMEDIVFATAPDPTYGLQVQDRALPGHPPEAQMRIEYQEIQVALSDGEAATLQEPRYSLESLGYGPVHQNAMLSPRVAPQMIGLGLLEAIPDADILGLEDPDDADGDGISGRANRVASPELGRGAVGRFGFKSGAATIADQSSGAFVGDMGLSTPLHPQGFGECTEAQTACRAARDGASEAQDGVEVSAEALELVVFYARNLAVPARRDVEDPTVLRGKQVFYESGCIACHTPKHVTHRLQTEGADALPEQSFQLIWPYTDLLLHDMGEGLADGRPEAKASGREWKTPPLWGIGLTQTVSGHTRFLHDGRARNLLEAVLWHGGEAAASRERVVTMPKADRDALIRFLESL